MEIKLLKHNEEAYQKLISCLKDHQKVAINHATGTGKSFILLKYLYENRNKNILYLAPTYQILDQIQDVYLEELGIKKQDFANINFNIYRNMMYLDMQKIKDSYDVIILDEYHRCGAKKWGKSIKRLISLIEEDPSKKIIGTTATFIRYLDHEKNMNNIIFDGVCASNLTLADAIIQGILPAPCYYTYLLDIKAQIEETKKLLNDKIFYEENKRAYLKKLEELENIITSSFNFDAKKKELNLKNGKYIVFCKNIKDIEKVKKQINTLLEGTEVSSYQIDSSKTKDFNKEELRKFRKNNDKVSILYSVNLLNEGVHVKGIDGIFMFRTTKSPIIYFQQLGRLLSYSGRKDKLYVFDFANNLKNHKVIYDLYAEVCSRVKKLINENPTKEERQRYNNILENFRIIDNNSAVLNELDNIKNTVTKDSTKSQRLKTAIDILSGKINTSNQEYLQAHIDLFTLSDLIGIEEYRKIANLEILKPPIFLLPEHEFINLLDDCNNLKEKEYKSLEKLLSRILKLAQCNKLPSILSDDENERSLIEEISNMYNKFDKEQKQKFKTIINDYEGKISPLDKIMYQLKLSETDLEQTDNELHMLFEKQIRIPLAIQKVLNTTNYTNKDKFKTHDLYENNQIENERKIFFSRLENFTKINDGKIPEYNPDNLAEQLLFLQMNMYLPEFANNYQQTYNNIAAEASRIDEKDEKEKVQAFAKRYSDFVNKKNHYPGCKTNKEMTLYIENIVYQDLLKKYNINLKTILEEKREKRIITQKKEIINKLEVFIKNNHGDLPSVDVSDEYERSFAQDFNRIKPFLSDEDKKYIADIIVESSDDVDFMTQYTNFIKRNKRIPLISKENIEEADLVRRFQRREKDLTKDEKKLIKISYNQKRQTMLKNTYAELIKRREN